MNDSEDLRRCEDIEAISRAAAEEFWRVAAAAIAAHGSFRVVLSGGSTPRRLYEILAAAEQRDRIDWAAVEFFWGDERPVPPDDPQSNFGMARAVLLGKVPALAEHIHRIEAERPDPDAAAHDYQTEISRVFGTPADGPPPAFDLVLLGLGPEGHTASLFPFTDALDETVRWAVPNRVDTLGVIRLTLTPAILNQARQVMFLVAGADKAEALAAVLNGPADPQRLPAQLIRPAQGKLLWLVDQAAAAQL